MKSAVENLDPTRVKLTVEVPYDELEPVMDHAYKSVAEQVNVPGFRKGKVPPRIIDQRVGRGPVIEHAVNDELPNLYRKAVDEADIRPLGQPDINVTEVPNLTGAPGGQLIFTAEVDIRPEVTLPDLAELEVTVDGVEVTDEDVDARLDALRERFATLVGVDRPVADGDFVSLDLVAKVGDEEVDSVSGVSYEVGSGTMLDGLDDAVLGLSAGETTTFTAPLAGGEHAGEEAEVTVTLASVKERDLPAVDDDFAQLASEFDTLEELREDLRRQVHDDKLSNQAVQARDALLAQLRDRIDLPVPAGLVDGEIKRHLEGEGKAEDDPHGEEIREEVTSLAKDQLILDALAERLGVGVTQDELAQFLLTNAQQYGVDPNEFVNAAAQTGQIPAFAGEVARDKALAAALRQVSVKDSSGAELDLSEYIGSDELDVEGAVADRAAAEQPSDVQGAVGDQETPEGDAGPGSPDSAESPQTAGARDESVRDESR